MFRNKASTAISWPPLKTKGYAQRAIPSRQEAGREAGEIPKPDTVCWLSGLLVTEFSVPKIEIKDLFKTDAKNQLRFAGWKSQQA